MLVPTPNRPRMAFVLLVQVGPCNSIPSDPFRRRGPPLQCVKEKSNKRSPTSSVPIAWVQSRCLPQDFPRDDLAHMWCRWQGKNEIELKL